MRSPAVPSLVGPAVRGRGEPFRRAILVLFVFWTAYGLLRAGLWWAIDPARYSPLEEPRLLAHALWRAWLWVVLSAAIWWLCRVVPWRPGRAPLLVAVHAAAAIAAALLESAWYRAAVVALRPGVTLRPFASRFLVDFTTNVFLYLAVAAVAYALHSRAVLDRCRLHAVRLKMRSTTARLHVLGRQLQPHFLCNALNAIAELFHRDLGRARGALGQLRALLLGPLSSPEPEIRLSEELAQLEPYLALQQLRFGDRLGVTVRAAPDSLPLYVPTFLLQPLVENAIRHGLGRRAAAGHIEIDAAVRGARLAIVVRDDGAGLPRVPIREGVGLGNTRLRLGELYGDDARLDLGPAPGGGTETRVLIPPRSQPRPLWAPVAAEPAPPLPAPPGTRGVVAVVLFGWTAMGFLWSGLRVLLDRYDPVPIGFFHDLVGSLAAAAVFAVATLGLVQASRAFPLDRGWRVALHACALVASVSLIPIARWVAAFGWGLPPVDEVMAANLQLDASVCIAVIAGTHAVLYLGRARERVLEAARHQDELATAALDAERMKIDPPGLAAALDFIGDLAERDAERADELAARLADDLRSTFLEEAPA